MEIWYAIPSANYERCQRCFSVWRERGYKTAVLIDKGAKAPDADLVVEADPYPGYYQTLIRLCKEIGDRADIVITGGDDILPDVKKAEKIGEEFYKHFPDGFGVMQPIGDTMPGVDTICASPWVGRGWIKRAYQGKHPVWPEYIAFYGDQELKEVSTKLGVLWQRKDIVQYHYHWSRPGGPPKTDYQKRNDGYWNADEKIFKDRQKKYFPGHEPLKG